MRIDCKHYESRTYKSGDTVRTCRLDLAPEAPWRCPVDCPRYEFKVADAGWVFGSLAHRPPPAEPEPGLDVAGLLDEAEAIVHRAGPAIVAEVGEQRARETASRRPLWRRILRRP